jgi:surface polysaccharide O-acyltransferase-like enzyme
MAKLNQVGGRDVYIDLIRAVAIVAVILVHAAGEYTVTPQQLSQMRPFDFFSWSVVDFYQTLSGIGVPLFVMLTGALLLQPEKNESLRAFFKKRWDRIGLPWIFWGGIYFAWAFLVIHIPFSSTAVIQGILYGPYTQFWYLYVLAGLYLLTPILRIFTANADPTTIKYFVIIWLAGVAILPFLGLLTPYQLNGNVFTLTGFIGYFVLGAYLLTIQIRRSTLSILMILGLALTAIGTYVLSATVGGTQMYFFQHYFSAPLILASVAVFMLLLTIKPPSVQKETNPSSKETSPSKGNKLIKVISENTLPLFLFHVIVMESFLNGYLGLVINRNTLNPIIEVPLMTVIVLFVSLAIILLLKKVPYLKRLIG